MDRVMGRKRMNKVAECSVCNTWGPASEYSRVRTITGAKVWLCPFHYSNWNKKTGTLNEEVG